MNRKTILLLVIVLMLVVSGCHSSAPTPPTAPTLSLSWATDGNPNVPVCGSVLVNCVQSYELLDVTTGNVTSLPIGTNSFFGVTTDSYEIAVSGYDYNGYAISSVYVVPTIITQ